MPSVSEGQQISDAGCGDGTAVGRRRWIRLRGSVSFAIHWEGRQTFFTLAGMQDNKKGPPVRPEGRITSRLKMARRRLRRCSRKAPKSRAFPPPPG